MSITMADCDFGGAEVGGGGREGGWDGDGCDGGGWEQKMLP